MNVVNNPIHAWVIDDDDSIRFVLSKALQKAGIETKDFAAAPLALDALHDSQPDVIVSDVRMPGMDGFNFMQRVNKEYPDLPVVITTAHSDLDSAVTSYESGAFEYLPKPFDLNEAVAIVERAAAHYRETNGEAAEEVSKLETAHIIGEAPAMQEVFRAIGRLSRSNITVLITGESGTGKELVASALHRHSPRAEKPFIAINTAAIPKDLLESELFGHEKGAFTGAQAQRIGRFEQANGGTLFLDEIGDMPADLQTRLLRVLADGEFYRVGGHTPVKVDVRIVAATHQDLEQHVKKGNFREDLYHRLNVIRVQLPALRERREDIPLLLNHFLARVATDLEVERKQLTTEVESFLAQLDWQGNVRQLENTCRWMTVMAVGQQIHIDDLPPELRNKSASEATAVATTAVVEPSVASSIAAPVAGNGLYTLDWENQLDQWAREQLKDGAVTLMDVAEPAFERVMIEAALAKTRNHKQEAAKLLGWGRNTLTRKIQQLGIE